MAEAANQPKGGRGGTVNWRVLAPVAGLALALAVLGVGIFAAKSARPRPDPTTSLAEARALIDKQEFEGALAVLNETALPILEAGYGTAEQRCELLRLRARSLYMGQELRGQDLEQNNRALVADYLKAEELGAKLEAAEVYQLARAQVSLGAITAAAQRARELPASEGELRRRIIRLIVERELALGSDGSGRGMELLAELLGEPSLSDEERAWAVARRAELQLSAGHGAEAIARLLRELQQLRTATPHQQAELRMLLGRAYLAMEDDQKAAEQLRLAGELLGAPDDMKGDVLALLGRIAERAGRMEETDGVAGARDRYLEVVQQFPNSEGVLQARVGLGRVEAALRNHDAAVEFFAQAVEDIKQSGPRGGVTAEDLSVSLMGVHADRFGSGAPGSTRVALRYAELAESLYPEGSTPAELRLSLARTHRRLAEETLAEARGGRRDLRWMDDVSPVTREEVKLRFLDAGKYFMSHARSVRMTDAAGYAASLWEAADSYDLAGDAESAQRALGEYIDGTTDNDPRRPEAKFRLAQVFQSVREYASAAALYQQLIDARNRVGAPVGEGEGGAAAGAAGAGGGAGPWGDRSLAPLAHCLLRDSDPANDKEAEEWLRAAVDGRTLTPDAIEYRDGLVELGRLLYETGRYAEAIERLTTAVERYPEDREIDSLMYRLADSYRLSAAAIAQELRSGAAMAQSEKSAREGARRERLASAMEWYLRAKAGLEGRDHSRLSDLERVQLRNSYFYLGDVAFDRGEYDSEQYLRAIEFYDSARQRYDTDPASLVAMVQIVNAYVEQGDLAKAATANARAQRYLEGLPPHVWEDPSLPMERKHWESWLKSSTLLERRAGAGTGTEGDEGG